MKTKSARAATKHALTAASQLDDYWLTLRMKEDHTPVQHLAVSDPARMLNTKPELINLGPKLTDAKSIYLKLKGHDRPKTFTSSAERACKYLISARGNKHILEYTKNDATAFRDALFERGLSGSSVSRMFGTIKTIISFAANEHGLSLINPFLGVYFDTKKGVTIRQPISVADIRTVQKACYKQDDEMRWLVALVADTGLRLAEAAGLHIDDLHLADEGIPFVRIRPHPWRRLKTEGSERDVPLVGSALWAAQRITERKENDVYAFPRYNTTEITNANSASAALNKWIQQYNSSHGTMHSYRHSIRDRLRSVACPSEIADQIGGWSSSANVGQSYGAGYSIEMMHRWLKKAIKHA